MATTMLPLYGILSSMQSHYFYLLRAKNNNSNISELYCDDEFNLPAKLLENSGSKTASQASVTLSNRSPIASEKLKEQLKSRVFFVIKQTFFYLAWRETEVFY